MDANTYCLSLGALFGTSRPDATNCVAEWRWGAGSCSSRGQHAWVVASIEVGRFLMTGSTPLYRSSGTVNSKVPRWVLLEWQRARIECGRHRRQR